MPNEFRIIFLAEAHIVLESQSSGGMMYLPDEFIFSQSSLQDFAECRRRFFLRYIQNLAWPAPPAEPFLALETALRRGALFHHIVHQHQLGCSEKRIEATISDDPDLTGWWHNYLAYSLDLFSNENGERLNTYAEHTLVTVLKNRRFLAKYDLLMIRPSRITIVDWKTGRQKPGGRRRQRLGERWQTKLYPWLIYRAGETLRDSGILPEEVEMIYWFADDPPSPEVFSFSQSEYEAVEGSLLSIVEFILGMAEGDFEKTEDLRHCVYCSYRSLCERGVGAGLFEAEDVDEMDDTSPDVVFDFAQIDELPYPG